MSLRHRQTRQRLIHRVARIIGLKLVAVALLFAFWSVAPVESSQAARPAPASATEEVQVHPLNALRPPAAPAIDATHPVAMSCFNGGTDADGICSCPAGTSGTLCEVVEVMETPDRRLPAL